MIKGIGLDIAELSRIEKIWNKYGMAFAKRFLTDREMEAMPSVNPVSWLGARFAAKEAAVKALGTGFKYGVHFKCVEILREEGMAPRIEFNGMGLEFFQKIGGKSVYVSLTHERKNAAAVVIIEGE